ncbi:hypothetical protein ACQEU5_09820 [Marinactinospora thermotolerans]|uniref:Phosphopantothenoylcysteine decarboxylase / phosphopantothenate--cysteine ligase n=1 Tax=Marinactinospora thermotolerans DSM 45154 TaxID=1122192 RepID=A0A1T4N985_9ACTN|nr:hypothetical protein [Marinactinospora thermotolerans]SJZ75627.1 phosphopantothenoylcysteine decarboxylase / phosphopantothenate--cysteine ligase [Marinactinospora thermotolerans DSM 45154]
MTTRPAASSADTRPRLVFGTGLLRTSISPAGAGFLWRRSPGPLADSAFTPIDPVLRSLVEAATAGNSVAVSVGRAEGPSRSYRTEGVESLAGRLLRAGPDTDLVPLFRGVGHALRAVHSVTPPADHPLPRIPRGMARLDTWLSRRPVHGFAGEAAALVHDRIGAERWSRLCAWNEQALHDPDRVVAHGAPSLGALVPGVSAPAVLLSGEDLCLAPWTFDLGWVTGELIEIKWQIGGAAPAWQALLDALYEGYGRTPESAWNRLAALRLALHLHDFTAYVGGTPPEVQRYADFLGFLIDL